VTGLLPEEDGIARGLAMLGTYLLTGHAISYGESVTLPDPLWPNVARVAEDRL
jgi:hypothetical protein